MVGVPKEPAVHIGASAKIGRVERLPGGLFCEVLHDCVRLGQDEAGVFEDGDAPIRVQLRELGLPLLALREIDRDQVDGETEVNGGHDGPAGVRHH